MDDSAIIDLLIEPATKDLGEFTVRRALPDKRRQRVGPFIFFDHMGPAEFPPGAGVNVRSHPHIGLATITYLFEGEILHRDSLGYVQPIRPGEINWMTAGSGIVHSEKASPELLASGQRLHGLQTWVALPLQYEETEPRFEHYSADGIPLISRDGAEIRVVIGSAYGESSPVRTVSETLYVEAKLDSGASLELPVADELAVYVVDGKIGLDEHTISAGVLAVLIDGAEATIQAETQAHVMICGGAALEGDRIVWWNFVSSSRERLEQAKRDWRDGRFGEVPGESDFIPLPDK
ncbi:MAG: pirin family protein [Gammaproteobacteria bacterium]|nr:pirin family protein [Gammaproteobacteria bacterium]MDH3752082.1 pirin family protein [Gammaproteobacteria bacterium]MDH3805697.1 pirin family protein [Gammaproteobacteria bacterium]